MGWNDGKGTHIFLIPKTSAKTLPIHANGCKTLQLWKTISPAVFPLSRVKKGLASEGQTLICQLNSNVPLVFFLTEKHFPFLRPFRS